MSERTCVCGHSEKEHEVIKGAIKPVCMHVEANGEIECDCLEFTPAETVEAKA